MTNFALPPDLLSPVAAHVRALAYSYPDWVRELEQHPHPGQVNLASWSDPDLYALVQTTMSAGCAFYGTAEVAAQAFLAWGAALLLDQSDRMDVALPLGHHWLLGEICQPKSGPRTQWTDSPSLPHQVRLTPDAIGALFRQVIVGYPKDHALYSPLMLTTGLALEWELLASQPERGQGIHHRFNLRDLPGPRKFQVALRRHPTSEPLTLVL